MKSLATEILHKEKNRCRVWQIATIITLTISVLELVVILF